MDEVLSIVKKILPTLDDGACSKLGENLTELGVTSVEDLEYIQEKDLLTVLKPIEARKLLKNWCTSSMYI